jgi:hypothetical protein
VLASGIGCIAVLTLLEKVPDSHCLPGGCYTPGMPFVGSPSQSVRLALVALTVLCTVGACFTACGDAFEPESGASTTAGTSSGSGTGGEGAATTTSSGGTSGGGSGTTTTDTSMGGGSAGGGSAECAHSFCDPGDELDPGCAPCVQDVCLEDDWCCTNHWDHACVALSWWVCGERCDGGAVSCTQQYGQAPSYLPCPSPTPGECRFATNTVGSSCAEICRDYGGRCLRAEEGGCQVGSVATPCTTTNVSTVTCVCSQGCNQGDPCPELQICGADGCG